MGNKQSEYTQISIQTKEDEQDNMEHKIEEFTQKYKKHGLFNYKRQRICMYETINIDSFLNHDSLEPRYINCLLLVNGTKGVLRKGDFVKEISVLTSKSYSILLMWKHGYKKGYVLSDADDVYYTYM